MDLPDPEEARRYEQEVWRSLQKGSLRHVRRSIHESEPEVEFTMSGSFPDTAIAAAFHDPLRDKDYRLEFFVWRDDPAFTPAPGIRLLPHEAASEIRNAVIEGEWRFGND